MLFGLIWMACILGVILGVVLVPAMAHTPRQERLGDVFMGTLTMVATAMGTLALIK